MRKAPVVVPGLFSFDKLYRASFENKPRGIDVGLEGIPIWGQWGILGLSIGLNIFGAVEFIRGTWTSRRNLDQVQKVADTYLHAWEVSEKKWEVVGPTLNNLVVTSDTILRILEAAPRSPDRESS